ncbi:hypothetical protein F5144DRAFT_621691 [Chaetomium tenue]|uniref:Uncharacterized protein n=1 Tax=Chaetomium tenue TaxID=1854479 RepID=A0ACB7P195_9PEZI|nr:hypothetical protein F5144DRAFT_621691 [Chaetomium globosum]
MAAPTRHDAASAVTFLVSGMAREDCAYPPYPYQDQLHEIDLVLLPAQAAGVRGRDSRRDGAYTAMLGLSVDLTTPPNREAGQRRDSDVDTRSVEVSLDEEDLAQRGVELKS